MEDEVNSQLRVVEIVDQDERSVRYGIDGEAKGGVSRFYAGKPGQ